MFQRLASAALASALIFSSTAALAADQAALAPGKPAGVKEAALHAPLWVWVAGIGFVALGVGLVSSGNGNGSSTGTTNNTHP